MIEKNILSCSFKMADFVLHTLRWTFSVTRFCCKFLLHILCCTFCAASYYCPSCAWLFVLNLLCCNFLPRVFTCCNQLDFIVWFVMCLCFFYVIYIPLYFRHFLLCLFFRCIVCCTIHAANFLLKKLCDFFLLQLSSVICVLTLCAVYFVLFILCHVTVKQNGNFDANGNVEREG